MRKDSKENRLLSAFGEIADGYIAEGEPKDFAAACDGKDAMRESGERQEGKEKPSAGGKRAKALRYAAAWIGSAAAVLAVVLGGVFLLFRTKKPEVASAAFEPDYTVQYDGSELPEEYLAGIRAFAAKTGRELLKTEEGKSTAYSPTALYMALSMVTELADDGGRAALLHLLEAESVEALRQNSGSVWRYFCANAAMEQPGEIMLANSLWLNKNYVFNEAVLKRLAGDYYVASFVGDMKKEIPAQVSAWVRKQTRDLLDCKLQTDKSTMAVLLSSIYFYDGWESVFDKYLTSDGRFLTEGEWVPCNYMQKEQKNWGYYRENGVTASVQYFKNGGKMLFVLPDEQVSPEEVLADTKLLEELFSWEALEKQTGTVDWSIPRFTLSDTVDLKESLTALGLGELFDSGRNSLPYLSGDGTPAYIGKAEQGTAVSIDEEGCRAASYVAILPANGEVPEQEEKIELYLTRPFVFAILSENDIPLFLGVVRNPNQE